MEALDLGRPAAASGRCPRCDLDDRPLWAATGHRVACASCCTRLYPGRALTFHGGAVVTATQHALLPDPARPAGFAAARRALETESGMKIGQAESIEVWDEGTYDAKVAAVEETESTWPGKEGTPRLKFVFRVRSDDGESYTDVWKFTNATLSKHKNATLRPLIRALLPDADLDAPEFVLDTDELVSVRCRVILGVDEEKGRNTIDKVLAPAARPARPAAQRAATPEPVPF